VVIAALFAGGFLLRVLNVYPGEKEPLILDFSAVALSLLYALLSVAAGFSAWRYVLIFSSSVIVFPHFVYILREK